MKLRFGLGWVVGALVALPAVGCLSASFSSGTGGGTTTTGTCASSETACADGCADLQTSDTDCGACGKKCDTGATCTAGKCTCPGTQMDCPGVGCVDLTNTPANCGSCGRSCGALGCADSQCTSTCNGMVCSGHCVNTTNDNSNCGDCGKACGTGAACVNSKCTCTGSTGMMCAGSNNCTDTNTDPSNCGGCGKPCSGGMTCSGGHCVCPSGSMMCGTSSACTPTISDPDNCGGCGTKCALGDVCVSSMCVCASSNLFCPGNGSAQPSVCTSPPGDSPLACGGCQKACANTEACSGGACVCRPGLTSCMVANVPTCVDINHDPNHCGGCDTVCVPAAETCIFSGGSASCQVVATPCPSGTTLCNNACVNTGYDPLNCGACGKICPTDQVCANSICQEYFPTTCSSCPCNECGSAHVCCAATPVICVAGSHCNG